jgi:hypothetical protein
MELLTG